MVEDGDLLKLFSVYRSVEEGAFHLGEINNHSHTGTVSYMVNDFIMRHKDWKERTMYELFQFNTIDN